VIRERSLRRLLLVGAAAFGIATAGSLVGILGLVVSMRDALERETADLITEQRIADQIVTSVYAQLFAAYRSLHDPRGGGEHRAEFRARGQHVYSELRRYLFFDMPVEARLGVEQIKELHQMLEVAAQRAIDHGSRDDSSTALLAQELQRRAQDLEAAVDRFVGERERHREELREVQARRLSRLLVASSIAAIALLFGVLAFSRLVRRRLLQPLRHLAEASSRFGSGELAARIPPQPDAEFSVLAGSFNDMASRVQRAHQEIAEQNRELTQALEKLHAAQQEVVQHEKLSAVGGMLAGLAHELNNPLTGVLGMSELLAAELRDADDPAVRALESQLVRPMHQEALRARTLVRNLLQFSRKSSSALDTIDLGEMIRVAIELRDGAFRQAGKRLVSHVPTGIFVLADRVQLEQAILNLINNALDAITQDRGTTLEIDVERDPDWVTLQFRDDGPGFQEVERAFDPFYTTKPVGAGTGLGLTLVHRFIEASGGAVTITNGVDGGATVSVRLRTTAPATLPPVVTDDEQPSSPETIVAAPAEAATDRATRALVVDDEPTIREVQRRLLQRMGIEVVLAQDAMEACRILEQNAIDLVISDVRMPGPIDGVGLYRWVLQEMPALAERFLFVTGDLHDTPAEVTAMPPERLLQKPFVRAEYQRRIELLIGKDQSLTRPAYQNARTSA
jgi:signal transduction histidine kinase